MSDNELAAYILRFLRSRNRGELDPVFEAMHVGDFERLLSELACVLHHRGHPPNWRPLFEQLREFEDHSPISQHLDAAITHERQILERTLQRWVSRAGVTPEEFCKWYGYRVEREWRGTSYTLKIYPVPLGPTAPAWAAELLNEGRLAL